MLQSPVDVFHHHHGIVDDEANGDGEAAHRHQIDRFAKQSQEEERHDGGDRKRQRGGQGQTPVAQEQRQNDNRQQAADDNRIADIAHRRGDEVGEVVNLGDAKA
jgi:hypothetical protein